MVSTTESARAYVRIPAVLRAGGNSWNARTRDLSRGGTLMLLEPPYPSGDCEVTLQLPTGPLTLKAEIRFTIPGVGVGMQFVDLSDEDRTRLGNVVDTASVTFGMWGLVGKYLAETETRAPLKLPGPAGNDAGFGAMRAALRQPTPAYGVDLYLHVLHPVGESGAAYRFLFMRPGCQPPAHSDLAIELPGFLRAAQGKVAMVAPQDVLLKLHAGSQPKPYRVVRMESGVYAAVVVSQVPGAPPRISFLTLAVGEQVAVSQRGQSVFPHYTDGELEQIRLDSVRGRMPRTTAEANPGNLRARAQFSGFQPFDAAFEAQMNDELARDTLAEVRKYGDRTVTLHPHVLVRVRPEGGEETVGVAMHDGKRFCVLQITPDGFGRVVPIPRDAMVSMLRR
ncbi:MAG: PilZ domain-containing protein [Myxococcota bacterium]